MFKYLMRRCIVYCVSWSILYLQCISVVYRTEPPTLGHIFHTQHICKLHLAWHMMADYEQHSETRTALNIIIVILTQVSH